MVVTFVLVLLIVLLVRSDNTTLVAPGVGIWVAAAIFGTSSTGFANPAVTLSRVITDTYTGIDPSSVTGLCDRADHRHGACGSGRTGPRTRQK